MSHLCPRSPDAPLIFSGAVTRPCRPGQDRQVARLPDRRLAAITSGHANTASCSRAEEILSSNRSSHDRQAHDRNCMRSLARGWRPVLPSHISTSFLIPYLCGLLDPVQHLGQGFQARPEQGPILHGTTMGLYHVNLQLTLPSNKENPPFLLMLHKFSQGVYVPCTRHREEVQMFRIFETTDYRILQKSSQILVGG